jgi:hypothetical protein
MLTPTSRTGGTLDLFSVSTRRAERRLQRSRAA